MTVSKVSSQPVAGFRMPTQDELKNVYRGIAESKLKNHTAKHLKKAPAGAEKYSHLDVTPKGLMGSKWEVYTIKGQLYLKLTPVVPNPKPTWYGIGPMPMF